MARRRSKVQTALAAASAEMDCKSAGTASQTAHEVVSVTVRSALSGSIVLGPVQLAGQTTISQLLQACPPEASCRGRAACEPHPQRCGALLHEANVLPEHVLLGAIPESRGLDTSSPSTSSSELCPTRPTSSQSTACSSMVPEVELQLDPRDPGVSDFFRASAEGDAGVMSQLAGKFVPCAKLGHGTFGAIAKVMDRDFDPPRFTAMKKVNVKGGSFVALANIIREVHITKRLDHPNVVRILDIYVGSSVCLLRMELMDMDLGCFLRKHGARYEETGFLQRDGRQLAAGLHYCHVNHVIHRDIKPPNILVHLDTTTLKLADFGLARPLSHSRPLTPKVISLWYRPPELLMGSKDYDVSVDIWSFGCILSEMATGKALFPGDSEIATLVKIFRLRGVPDDDEVWSGVGGLPLCPERFPHRSESQLSKVGEKGPGLGEGGLELLDRCLSCSPQDRPSSRAVVAHRFFQSAGSEAS
mmetsp:Transcript_1109/g.3390  ORF Transcript_1109/g.3390 Transcript_1109/m.3390 type:complete len:473 (-) Transcript_1109:177-1595(-)